MKKILALSSTLVLISYMFFNVAQAEGADTYVGIQYGSADTTVGGVPNDFDLEFLALQIGVWVSDNTSLELRMGKGNGKHSAGGYDLEIESMGGLYGTYHWPLGDQASIYGIAGWSTASFKLSQGATGNQEDENDISYGVGVKISVLSVEYMSYLDNSNVKADVVSVALQYGFD